MDIARAAARRLEHFDRREPDPAAVVSDPEQGYAIQAEVARLRQERGEVVIGYKVGCTSPATQRQMGIDSPIFGRLYEGERWSSGVALPRERFLPLAFEGEIAVRLGPDLAAAPDGEAVLASVEHVFAVIELHHFPYRERGPTAAELIASNGVHAGFVVADGGAGVLEDVPTNLSIEIDGEEAAAVSGPELTRTVAASLAWLARELPSRGERLLGGDTVLCGTVAPLLPAPEAREVAVTTDRFGAVRCTIE
ncbi:MAG: hypothetical protein F4X36_20005 [Gammaproteobacteria bacterium]|nr:hypothetical protein [Gammaproteobacteria bacterium]